MIQRFQDPLLLVGRILLVALFVWSGFGKIPGYAGTAAYMQGHGMSEAMVSVLLPATIALELGGGLLIAIGWFTRPLALIYFLYLIPVSLLFHGASDMASEIQFMKNVSIMGAMLMLAAAGAGRYSVDARRA